MEDQELIGLVERIMRAEGPDEAQADRLVDAFQAEVVMPAASDLIFWPERHFDHDPSAEEIVARARSYRPIEL